MCKIKHYYFVALLLMMIALTGRLIAGSIPFPPASPFFAPSGAAFSQEVQHHGSYVKVVDLEDQSGKKDDHHKTDSSYPWYGLPGQLVSNHSKDLLSSISNSSFYEVFCPDLKSSLRPPTGESLTAT